MTTTRRTRGGGGSLETVTLYRAKPELVNAVRNGDRWLVFDRQGQRLPDLTDAEFQERYVQATAQDLLVAGNGGIPAAPRATSVRRQAGKKAAGRRSGRTSPPSPDILARAKELWRAGEPVEEIARVASSMGRTVKPQAVYGWAERYHFGARGRRNGGGKKNLLSRGGGKAPGG